MRIAYITNEFVSEPTSFDGGLSNYLYKVCKTLKEFGHEPIVFVSSGVDEVIEYEGIKVYRVASKQNVIFKLIDKLTRFKLLKSINMVNNSYYLNKKVKEINKTDKIDVLQYPSFLALGLFVPNKIPSVLRISSYQRLIDKANGNNNHSFKDEIPLFLQDLTYKRAKNIIGPSKFLGDFISNKFNCAVKVIESPNVPFQGEEDVTVYDCLTQRISGRKYLLFFGRLAMLKGVIDIADMLNDLLINYKDYCFVFVGKDVGYQGKPTLDYIRSKSEGVESRVIHIGPQNHSKLYPLIRGSELVLLPSRIENFPNACVEAMSLGKIVVATKGVSFEQLINDKENGFLANNASPDDLRITIENVLNMTYEEKSIISEKAKETIKRLNPKDTVTSLLDFYKTIIN